MDKEKAVERVKEVKDDKAKMLGVIWIISCCMAFLLGFSCKKDETIVTFTEDDIKVITEMQKTYDDDITVHKTKDGKLMIEWDD